ncbi:MAG: hypothetical protein HPY65_07590 [Syntrophaceae bacterium]|nr:hypothetical protein [Syntrophaceae bacterium]
MIWKVVRPEVFTTVNVSSSCGSMTGIGIWGLDAEGICSPLNRPVKECKEAGAK